MDADEKRKVFEELLEEYQNFIESEFSYEDGEREEERKAWLNKYDGIKEPLIKDEKVRKAVRAWAELVGADSANLANFKKFRAFEYEFSIDYDFVDEDGLTISNSYTIAELCGEEEE